MRYIYAAFSATMLAFLDISLSYAAPLTYSLVDLGPIVRAYGINNSGLVVGEAPGDGDRIYTWQNGEFSDFGIGRPTGINNSGVISGFDRLVSTEPMFHAATWAGTKKIDLGTLGGANSFANSINDHGQVVGLSQTDTNAYHATLWEAGNAIDLGTLGGIYGYASQATSINNSGQIVGHSEGIKPSLDIHATLWSEGTITDLGTLGGTASFAHSINDLGQIVGYSYTVGNSSYHATIWDNGIINDLGSIGTNPFDYTNSYALDINSQQLIVGASAEKATLWYNGSPIAINTLLDATGAGWSLQVATAVNDSGFIVGYGQNPQLENHGFLLIPITPVPEPSIWLTMLIGIGVFISYKPSK